MKKAGVILAGCGYLDGAEIQEAVFTLSQNQRGGGGYPGLCKRGGRAGLNVIPP